MVIVLHQRISEGSLVLLIHPESVLKRTQVSPGGNHAGPGIAALTPHNSQRSFWNLTTSEVIEVFIIMSVSVYVFF